MEYQIQVGNRLDEWETTYQGPCDDPEAIRLAVVDMSRWYRYARALRDGEVIHQINGR